MSDLTKYNTLVAWYTYAKSIVNLTRGDENNVPTFNISIKSIDPNNIGVNLVDIDYTFTDNIGTPYKVIAHNETSIDVADVFRKGCPVGNKLGIVHKSAYKGFSIHLPTELLWRLHKTAVTNNNKFAMSILWQNDPNGRRVAFTDVEYPQIADYRGTLTDMNGCVFKPMEDYGQNPRFEVWLKTEDGKYSKLGGTSEPQKITSLVDGLIDSIRFSAIGDLMTGYYVIYN